MIRPILATKKVFLIGGYAVPERHHYIRVDFRRFKALPLRRFNILVGPNNSGKSTILAAFRILAAGLRRANTRKAVPVLGPIGHTMGHGIDLTSISVAEENIFFNYDDSQPATVEFHLSNGNSLLLYFPEQGICNLIPNVDRGRPHTPSAFKAEFNCPIGFVPILGPVEHEENIFRQRGCATCALQLWRITQLSKHLASLP